LNTGEKGINLSEVGRNILIDKEAIDTSITLNGSNADDKFIIKTDNYLENSSIIIKGDLKDGNDYMKFDSSKNTFTSMNIDLYGLINSSGSKVIGGGGDDTITSTKFNDTVEGGGGHDKFYTKEGDDTIIIDSYDTVVDGGGIGN